DRTGVAVALGDEGSDSGHVSLSFASGHACRGLDGDRETGIGRRAGRAQRDPAAQRRTGGSDFLVSRGRPKAGEESRPDGCASRPVTVRSASLRGRSGWREKRKTGRYGARTRPGVPQLSVLPGPGKEGFDLAAMRIGARSRLAIAEAGAAGGGSEWRPAAPDTGHPL